MILYLLHFGLVACDTGVLVLPIHVLCNYFLVILHVSHIQAEGASISPRISHPTFLRAYGANAVQRIRDLIGPLRVPQVGA